MTKETTPELKIKWENIVEGFYNPIIRQMNLCNGTMYNIISFMTLDPRLFVGIERKGCFLFPIVHPIHWEYASEKLCLFEADARIIADWINAQINESYEQQGQYHKGYLEELQGDKELHETLGKKASIFRTHPLQLEIIE